MGRGLAQVLRGHGSVFERSLQDRQLRFGALDGQRQFFNVPRLVPVGLRGQPCRLGGFVGGHGHLVRSGSIRFLGGHAFAGLLQELLGFLGLALGRGDRRLALGEVRLGDHGLGFAGTSDLLRGGGFDLRSLRGGALDCRVVTRGLGRRLDGLGFRLASLLVLLGNLNRRVRRVGLILLGHEQLGERLRLLLGHADGFRHFGGLPLDGVAALVVSVPELGDLPARALRGF